MKTGSIYFLTQFHQGIIKWNKTHLFKVYSLRFSKCMQLVKPTIKNENTSVTIKLPRVPSQSAPQPWEHHRSSPLWQSKLYIEIGACVYDHFCMIIFWLIFWHDQF